VLRDAVSSRIVRQSNSQANTVLGFLRQPSLHHLLGTANSQVNMIGLASVAVEAGQANVVLFGTTAF
jgi:hypothetical protein